MEKTISTGGLLAVTMLLASCGGGQYQMQQMPPAQVVFQELSKGTAQTEKQYPGSVEGRVNVDIKAQVSGYLDEIYVKEGDYVKQGQQLFRIRGDVFAEQVNNSQAALTAAMAAEESARIELEKVKPLVAGQVISPVQLQTAEASYATAKAQVAQAKAALGSSRINADFSLIKAPVSGYIGRIPNRTGNLVTPADVTPLTTLSEINEVFVYFSLSEPDYLQLRNDLDSGAATTEAVLIMANGATYTHKGRLETASGNIDRLTGTMAMKAVFPNPDKLLRSGGTGKVVLRKTESNVITLPVAAVKDIQNKYFVFRLADSNKVAMVPIEISGRANDIYVLKSGLTVGQKIALDHIDVLADGMPVAPAGSQPPASR